MARAWTLAPTLFWDAGGIQWDFALNDHFERGARFHSDVVTAGKESDRGTDSAEQIEMRLRNAIGEMAEWRSYRYTILSGSAEDDEINFRALVRAERMRSHRMILSQ